MKKFLVICYCMGIAHVYGQEGNSYVTKGNDAYRKNDYKAAAAEYQKALDKDPANNVAKFNLGNSLQKQNDVANALKQYDDILRTNKDASLQAKTLYNKGLALARQNNLDDAIEAFKQALNIDPEDNDTRENLQKAINEKRQKQQPKQKKQQSQEKPKPQSKQRQPNKQMMEQKFAELRNQEKQLQKQLQRKQQEGQQEKDW